MSIATQITFDPTQASTYMPHRVVKQAVLVPVPDGVETTINAEWGAPQSFVGPWYAIYVDGNVTYGSGKNTPIDAYIYEGDEATVATILSSGVQETVNTVTNGDWLVRWPHGEGRCHG
jgi:hypothetical protein